MHSRRLFVAVVGAWVVLRTVATSAHEPAPAPSEKQTSATEVKSPDPAALARDKARLMHQIYSSTLEVMHDRFFHNDRATVPARALEDVFADLKRQTKIQSNWIGVNAKILSINHDPKDDFEKFAAKALGKGEASVERVEGNLYRRAEAIPLSSGCLTCHGTLGLAPKTPRVAGLVISIPLKD